MKSGRTLIVGAVLLSILPFLALLPLGVTASPTTNMSLFMTQLVRVFGSVSGLIGAVLLVWQFVLGIRHSVSYITPDRVWVNWFHKIIAQYGLLLVFVHPFLELFTYAQNFLWLFLPNFSSSFEFSATLGKFAFILFIIVWVTSAVVRGKIKYRPWLYIHYLSYPLLFLVLLHAKALGTSIQTYPVVLFSWYVMLALFVMAILFRVLIASGAGKERYRVTDVEKVGEFTVLVTLSPLGGRLIPTIGQHIYLGLKRFGEAHPYTVMEYHEKNGDLIFGVRTVGAFSKKIQSVHVGDVLYLDGPYGVFTREGHNELPKTIIAGGIGVTPFVDLVRKYGKGTVFLHANRTPADIVRRDVLIASSEQYCDFLDDKDVPLSSDPHIILGRIDAPKVMAIMGDTLLTRKYFVCGSPMFIKNVLAMLRSLNIPPSHIFYEELGF